MCERMTYEEAKVKYPHMWIKLQDPIWKDELFLIEATIVDVRENNNLTWAERDKDEEDGFVWWHTHISDVLPSGERVGVEIHGEYD